MNRPAYDSGIKPYPLLGTIPVNDTSGSSIYNGAHVQVQRRMTKGLQFDTSYTWSHAIDNSPAGFDSDYRYGGNVVDPFQWQTKERGNSNQDVRNRFILSALYELPFATRPCVWGRFESGCGCECRREGGGARLLIWAAASRSM